MMVLRTPAAGLLEAIGRLADVIERENAALVAGGRDPVRPLLEEKRTACRTYEEAVRELADPAGRTMPRAPRCGRRRSGSAGPRRRTGVASPRQSPRTSGCSTRLRRQCGS
jgi:hypothetical protein